MKKNMKYLLSLAIISLFSFVNVKAAEIQSADIQKNTYVIGTHMFTDKTMLSTSHIMLAAKTIDSSNIEDMIIYYKKPRTGEWINGATGQAVEVPTSFEIDYIDLSGNIETPTLSIPAGAPGSGILTITYEGNYSDSNLLATIDGVELYEKNGDALTLIYESNSIFYKEIAVDVGESKTYVARVYVYNQENEKIYSDYSNEVVISYQILVPTLSATHGSGIYGGESSIYTSIIFEGAYAYEGSMDNIDGVELYEIIGDDYSLIETSFNGRFSEIITEFGTSRTFVARVYALDSDGNKVYSDYSDELVLDNSTLPTPTLSNSYGSAITGGTIFCDGINIVFEGAYAYEGSMDNIDGVELYEIINDEYTLIETSSNGSFSQIAVELGKVRTFVARVYALDSDGNKVYSDYSDELVLKNNELMAPTVTFTGSAINLKGSLTILEKGTYSGENATDILTGVEYYEKVEEEYVKVTEEIINFGFNRQFNPGENKTYVARVYIENDIGNKFYSGYSEECMITVPPLAKPTLSAAQGTEYHVGLTIYVEGAYAEFIAHSGLELYEKNGDEYTLLQTKEKGQSFDMIETNTGENKTYVARTFWTTSGSEKIYSDYSNEIVISALAISAPTLFDTYKRPVGYQDGMYIYDLGINSYDYYDAVTDTFSVAGYEVYEKNGTNYISIGTGEMGGAFVVSVEAGTSKTFVSRVYVLNSNNEKVYSDYSSEIVVGLPDYTPTFTKVEQDNSEALLSIQIKRKEGENEVPIYFDVISGFEVYTKIDDEYIFVSEKEITDGALLSVIQATVNVSQITENVTLVVRSYTLNTKGERTYSGYSNEVVIDCTKYEAPTLANIPGAVGGSEYVGFEDGKYIYDLAVNALDYYDEVTNTFSVSGYEVYEKNGTNHVSIGTGEMGGAVVAEVEAGTSKTFVARVYTLDNQHEKVYSGYSNELVITAPRK